jgi:hypothetical protein
VTIKDVDYENKKNNEIKDAYPKKVCHMPKRHVKKKRKKKRCILNEGMPHAQKACQKKKKKDSPHPRKIKKRDGSCKGVHPPSAKKNPHTCTS